MNDNGMNSPGAAAASCYMNDSGMNNLITIMAPPWSRIRFCSYPAIIHVAAGRGCARAVHAAIIHVEGADMDDMDGAYVVAENNTFNNPYTICLAWDLDFYATWVGFSSKKLII